MAMSVGLRTLLAGIVDYAGLFPPARLALEPALTNYVRHGRQGEAWMLGRFVIPAARLGELAPLASLFPTDSALTFSALGRGGATAEEFLTGLNADFKDIDAFHERHGRAVRVDAFEVKLPPDVLAAEKAVSVLLEQVRRRLERFDSSHLPLFFEAPAESAGRLAPVLLRRRNCGFKLRCGGLQPADFPSSAQVASALTTCVESDVPFKATAAPAPSPAALRRHGAGAHARLRQPDGGRRPGARPRPQRRRGKAGARRRGAGTLHLR
jgi:hypothetical protein